MRRGVILRVIAAALASATFAGALTAQDAPPRERPAGQSGPRRQQLEAQLRQRLWRITKNRVGLTDEQMTRLAQASRPFDVRRRQLAMEERNARLVLRRELLAGAKANEERVGASLDRVLELQRRRAELQIEEQRALASFMNPLQRARYAALQEQLRRRADSLRGRRGAMEDSAR